MASRLESLQIRIRIIVSSKDIAPRVEAIPIQTLTISDEQFLKGDAYGKPTTIAGGLRIAQGSGRLPPVVLGREVSVPISMYGAGNSNRWAYPPSLWIQLPVEGSSAPSSTSRNLGD